MAITSLTTFDVMTKAFIPRAMVDNILVGTPTLQYLRKNLQPVAGKTWNPRVYLQANTGEWYTRHGVVTAPTTLSAEIADEAIFDLYFYRFQVLLPRSDVLLNKAGKLIDLLKSYVHDATEGTRTDLSAALFDATVTNGPLSLNEACDNLEATAYGGLTPGDGSGYEYWRAHVMEGDMDNSYFLAVSPSLENISKMIRAIRGTCGKNDGPGLVVVDEDYWDTLSGQITRNEYLMALAAHASADVVKWGFDSLFVNNVPVVSDRDCPGEAFTAGQTTRLLAKGHEAFFLNFKHMKLAYNREASWKWDENGWVKPNNYDDYLNFFYVWSNVATDSRRALGRIFNVDITQAPANWGLGDVDLPGIDLTP